MRIVSFLTLLSLASFAFESTMSMQGFTGLINTPNAQTLKQGDAVIHFDNQFDNHLRGYDYERDYSYEEDYIFGIGFLPYFEVQGRLTEARGYIRDLSANAKLQLPWHHEYLPDFAIGIQDAGGAANNYDNTYVVIDKTLWRFRASIGYGMADTNERSSLQSKRMDGVFGGLEVELAQWLHLLAEDDTQEQHAGVRLSLPKAWELPVGLDLLVAANLTNDNEVSLGFNLNIPLLHPSKDLSPLQEESSAVSEPEPADRTAMPETPAAPLPRELPATSLQQRLADYGFENVRVGESEKSLHVSLENNLFDHNELDAIGAVLGAICRSDEASEQFALTLLRSRIEIMTLYGSTEACRDYLDSGSTASALAFRSSLRMSFDDESDVVYAGDASNSSLFTPRLELSPGLATAVGTEVGVFDYLLSLRANLYTTLYDGLVISAMAEVPLAHSENFDEGKIYYRMYEERMESRLVNAMAHQTLHYGPLLNTLSAGLYQSDYYGVLNQTDLQLFNGMHAFKARLGSFAHKDNSDDTRDIYLGSYRFFYAPYDLSAEITYGQYWHQDRGPTVELKRDFNDISIAFVFQDAADKYAGARVSIPLTPQKLYATDILQIKGKNDFSYGLRSTIQREDGTNTLNPSGALVPLSDLELSSYYRNRDRISLGYIKAHIERMRDAAIHYNIPE